MKHYLGLCSITLLLVCLAGQTAFADAAAQALQESGMQKSQSTIEQGLLQQTDATGAVSDPMPCLGFNPSTGEWSKQVVAVREAEKTFDYFVCPAATAIFSVFKQAMKPLDGKYIGIDANCCPLPSADILLDEHVEAETECPENFVATGGHLHRYGNKVVRPLRCTKLNTERYQLGPRSKGVFWGAAGSAAFPMQEWKRIKLSDIPLGIRYGVTRYEPTQAWFAGCIAERFGSVLVGKLSKRCAGHLFSELQYRGTAGDPAQGTPVEVVAKCSHLSNPFDPKGMCEVDEGLEAFRAGSVE